MRARSRTATSALRLRRANRDDRAASGAPMNGPRRFRNARATSRVLRTNAAFGVQAGAARRAVQGAARALRRDAGAPPRAFVAIGESRVVVLVAVSAPASRRVERRPVPVLRGRVHGLPSSPWLFTLDLGHKLDRQNAQIQLPVLVGRRARLEPGHAAHTAAHSPAFAVAGPRDEHASSRDARPASARPGRRVESRRASTRAGGRRTRRVHSAVKRVKCVKCGECSECSECGECGECGFQANSAISA